VVALPLCVVCCSPVLGEARAWYTKAAEAGNTTAQTALGVLLATALSPPDLDGGRVWLTRAAEAGNADAQYALGVLLADRLDPPDLDGGRVWLTRAAEAGNANARNALEQGDLNRQRLRRALGDLAEDKYRILLVSGPARSGKSYTWVLVTQLRDSGTLVGVHRFVLVTTHDWAGEVTGEDLASSLAYKLDLNITLPPSGELPDARARMFLAMIVARYPTGDGATQWIVLDGLDRPGVLASARDVAKQLITLVDEGRLPLTRLIVTGLDIQELAIAYPAVAQVRLTPLN